MADNVAISAGTGTSIATDDIGSVHYQRVKPAYGVDGVATDVSGTNPLPVRPGTPVVLTWTPTLDTGAYATGDSLYTTVTTLANAVSANGKSLRVDKITVLDKSSPSGVNNPSAIALLFFNASMSPSAANAASAISDADMANCIAAIPVGPWESNTINSFSDKPGMGQLLKAGAGTTSLYVCGIVRGTPTWGASDLVFTLYGYEEA